MKKKFRLDPRVTMIVISILGIASIVNITLIEGPFQLVMMVIIVVLFLLTLVFGGRQYGDNTQTASEQPVEKNSEN